MDVDTAMAALVMTFISRVFFSFTVLTRPYPWPVPCQEELNNFVQLGARRHVRGCRFSDINKRVVGMVSEMESLVTRRVCGPWLGCRGLQLRDMDEDTETILNAL